VTCLSFHTENSNPKGAPANLEGDGTLCAAVALLSFWVRVRVRVNLYLNPNDRVNRIPHSEVRWFDRRKQ